MNANQQASVVLAGVGERLVLVQDALLALHAQLLPCAPRIAAMVADLAEVVTEGIEETYSLDFNTAGAKARAAIGKLLEASR